MPHVSTSTARSGERSTKRRPARYSPGAASRAGGLGPRLGRRRTSSAPSATIAACASSTGAVPSQRAEPATSMPTPCDANCAMVRPVTARITSRPGHLREQAVARRVREGVERAHRRRARRARSRSRGGRCRSRARARATGSAASTWSSVSSRRGSRRSADGAADERAANRLGSMLAICTAPVHSALARELAHHQPGQHHLLEPDAAEPRRGRGQVPAVARVESLGAAHRRSIPGPDSASGRALARSAPLGGGVRRRRRLS